MDRGGEWVGKKSRLLNVTITNVRQGLQYDWYENDINQERERDREREGPALSILTHTPNSHYYFFIKETARPTDWGISRVGISYRPLVVGGRGCRILRSKLRQLGSVIGNAERWMDDSVCLCAAVRKHNAEKEIGNWAAGRTYKTTRYYKGSIFP